MDVFRIALTSIGIDGESRDIVTNTQTVRFAFTKE